MELCDGFFTRFFLYCGPRSEHVPRIHFIVTERSQEREIKRDKEREREREREKEKEREISGTFDSVTRAIPSNRKSIFFYFLVF